MGLVKAFHKLLKIFQKKFPLISLQNAQKLLFITKAAQKLLEKQNLFWSGAKICKLYNKNKISKHFCAILGCNQHC